MISLSISFHIHTQSYWRNCHSHILAHTHTKIHRRIHRPLSMEKAMWRMHSKSIRIWGSVAMYANKSSHNNSNKTIYTTRTHQMWKKTVWLENNGQWKLQRDCLIFPFTQTQNICFARLYVGNFNERQIESNLKWKREFFFALFLTHTQIKRHSLTHREAIKEQLLWIVCVSALGIGIDPNGYEVHWHWMAYEMRPKFNDTNGK